MARNKLQIIFISLFSLGPVLIQDLEAGSSNEHETVVEEIVLEKMDARSTCGLRRGDAGGATGGHEL
jgi:hypothetical protein